MARFVKFPGLAGSFADTPDVNILDADTSHLVQGQGFYPTFQTPAAKAEAFGGVSNGRTLGPGAGSLRTELTNQAPPVPPSTELSVGMDCTYETGTCSSVTGILRQHDSGGAQVGSIQTQTVPNPVTGVTQRLVTPPFITEPDCAFISVTIDYSTLSDSTRLDMWNLNYNIGTDASFIPSLRIVGSLDIRVDAAAVDWAVSQSYVNKYLSSSGERAFTFFANSNRMRSGVSTDGEVGVTKNSNLLNLDPGSRHLIRVTIEPAAVEQEWFIDGLQHGSTIDPGVPSIWGGSSQPLQVGDGALADEFAGDVYFAEVRDGIDGPVVARFDAEDVPLS